jgi:AcrR family transcriptional regulator
MGKKNLVDDPRGAQLENRNMNQSSTFTAAPSTPPTLRGQRTRQKLLEAAEAVFGELGYEGAAISEITRAAKVAQGTFYVYFPDKKAIFTELVKNLSQRLRQTISEAVGELTDRLEIEEAGLRTFFAFVRDHRNLYRIVRQAEFVDEELYRWYYRELALGYTLGLEKAMRHGQIRRMDPETLAFCLMGIGDFLGMRWVLWEKGEIPPKVFETMMSFVRFGLSPEAAKEGPHER